MNLLKMIVERDQIGDILADGVKKAAEKIGKGAEKFAVHANGQELPMHDSRHSPSLACSYVADPSPGRHTAASIDFMEIAPVHKFLAGVEKPPPHKKHKYGTKGPAQAHMVKIHQTINALGFCYFGTICGPLPLLESLKCTHGWDLTHEDLFKIGYRIQTLRQLFNVRDGAVQFDINERALGIEPLKKGPLKGITVDVRTMTKDYFKNMDWDPDKGIPTEETIKKLGLEFAMDALDSAGECGDIYDLPSVSK